MLNVSVASDGAISVKVEPEPGMVSLKSNGVSSAGVASLTMVIVPVSRLFSKTQVTTSSFSTLIVA